MKKTPKLIVILMMMSFVAVYAHAGDLNPTAGPTTGTMHTLTEVYNLINDVNTKSGNAGAGDVLSGKTFSNSSAMGVSGTMPDNGAATITPGTAAQAIPAGYHNGSGTVTGDADLVAGNIKAGVDIFGVTGTAASGSAYPAPVAKTGQTTSYTTGDDGDLQKGVAIPSPRFTDNGDGTVTDNLTGLIWLKNANAVGQKTWAAGVLIYCNALASGTAGLTDGSVAGDWRLPNRFELESLTSMAYFSPCISNAAGTGKWTANDPFTNVQSTYYWSGTTFAYTTDYAWDVNMSSGHVNYNNKSNSYCVWPVRGGQ